MPDFITLTCPSCGGKLEVTPDLEQFACGYCGKEHIVKRGGGIASLAPLVENIKKVQHGVDRTASELAIKRIKDEIAGLTADLNKIPKKPKFWETEEYINGRYIALFLTGSITLFLFYNTLKFLIEFDINFILTTVFMVIFGYLFYYNSPFRKKDNSPINNQADIDAWDRQYSSKLANQKLQIDEKQAELKHHQDLVSNYK